MSVLDRLVDKIYSMRGHEIPAASLAERLPGLTGKGFTGRNGGAQKYVEAPPEFEATSSQVCGFWPFSVGASSPLIGAVLGRNLLNGSVVCGDPMTNFVRGVISSPSAFVLGLNGRGKSSLAVRIAICSIDLGYLVLVLGDLKPDFVGLMAETGGKVIDIGRGTGGINPLDCGPWKHHLHRLGAEKRQKVSAQIHGRRVNALAGLIELLLHDKLSEENSEITVLSVAIGVAADEAAEKGQLVQPLPSDVQAIIASRHPRIRANILASSDEEYDASVRRLLTGLNGLNEHGPYGDVFCRQTTEEMPLDQSVNFNVASIDETDVTLRAAVQLVCWSYGQAGAHCAKTLAEEVDEDGVPLAPQRHHLMIMDELWQILQAWEGSVYRINGITKVNRTEGLGQIMITHSMKDLELSTEERTKIAIGFVERSAMLYLGGLARNEMDLLDRVRRFSNREKNLMVEWSSEGTVNPSTGKVSPPPGRGKFLLKTGEHPGVPFRTELTAGEHRIHDTNSAWAQAMTAAGTR